MYLTVTHKKMTVVVSYDNVNITNIVDDLKSLLNLD